MLDQLFQRIQLEINKIGGFLYGNPLCVFSEQLEQDFPDLVKKQNWAVKTA